MIDLHVHTSFSDGTFSPAEMMALASERGVTVVGLADHDTIAGWGEMEEAARARGIEMVPGVEISAICEGSSVHVLAYWPDPGNAEFRAELARLHDDRFLRGQKMVEKLQALGYPITFERVQEIAEGGSIVRPHIAQALVEAGVVETVTDAFTPELIADGGKADVQKHALHPMEALALIKRAGGLCVLGHPGMWGAQGELPDSLVEEMAAAGMDGLEADHPDHTDEQRARYRALAQALGLVFTGGSDCHGAHYDPVRLGCVTTEPEQYAKLKALSGRR